MEYGICTLAIIPMRASATEKSEMVSQLLFGEVYSILDREDKWLFISSLHDAYEGWISANQFTAASESEHRNYFEANVLTSEPVNIVVKSADNTLLHVPFGSSFSGLQASKLTIARQQYDVTKVERQSAGLITMAQSFVNTPYLWGGRTHFGIDCSGLVQAVFRQLGVSLRRDAYLQAEGGEVVHFLQEVKPGDVAFFDNDEGKIVHVGILINEEKIIHASGKVKIEHIDAQGIYSEEFKRYTHKLRIIKRFI